MKDVIVQVFLAYGLRIFLLLWGILPKVTFRIGLFFAVVNVVFITRLYFTSSSILIMRLIIQTSVYSRIMYMLGYLTLSLPVGRQRTSAAVFFPHAYCRGRHRTFCLKFRLSMQFSWRVDFLKMNISGLLSLT